MRSPHVAGTLGRAHSVHFDDYYDTCYTRSTTHAHIAHTKFPFLCSSSIASKLVFVKCVFEVLFFGWFLGCVDVCLLCPDSCQAQHTQTYTHDVRKNVRKNVRSYACVCRKMLCQVKPKSCPDAICLTRRTIAPDFMSVLHMAFRTLCV